jgi:hypothetical protein
MGAQRWGSWRSSSVCTSKASKASKLSTEVQTLTQKALQELARQRAMDAALGELEEASARLGSCFGSLANATAALSWREQQVTNLSCS